MDAGDTEEMKINEKWCEEQKKRNRDMANLLLKEMQIDEKSDKDIFSRSFRESVWGMAVWNSYNSGWGLS